MKIRFHFKMNIWKLWKSCRSNINVPSQDLTANCQLPHWRQLQTSRLDSHQWEHGFIPETRKQKGGDFSNFIAWNHLKPTVPHAWSHPLLESMTHLADPLLPAGKTVPVPISYGAVAPMNPPGAHSKIAGFLAGLRMFIPPKYGKSSGFIRCSPIKFFDDVKWRLRHAESNLEVRDDHLGMMGWWDDGMEIEDLKTPNQLTFPHLFLGQSYRPRAQPWTAVKARAEHRVFVYRFESHVKSLDLGHLAAIKGDDFPINTMIPGFGRTGFGSWSNLARYVYTGHRKSTRTHMATWPHSKHVLCKVRGLNLAFFLLSKMGDTSINFVTSSIGNLW